MPKLLIYFKNIGSRVFMPYLASFTSPFEQWAITFCEWFKKLFIVKGFKLYFVIFNRCSEEMLCTILQSNFKEFSLRLIQTLITLSMISFCRMFRSMWIQEQIETAFRSHIPVICKVQTTDWTKRVCKPLKKISFSPKYPLNSFFSL